MGLFVVSLFAVGTSVTRAETAYVPNYVKGSVGANCDQTCSGQGMIADADGYIHLTDQSKLEEAFSFTCNDYNNLPRCTCSLTDSPIYVDASGNCLGRDSYDSCGCTCDTLPPTGSAPLCTCYASCASVTCPLGWDRIPHASSLPATYGRSECCVRPQFVPSAASGVTWTLGAFGASCDQTCENLGSKCDLISLTSIQDKVHFAVALNQAQPNADMDSVCRCEDDAGSPAITGSSAPRTCTWGAPDTYTCSAASAGAQMLCACKEPTCDSFDCATQNLIKKPNAESIKGSTAEVCCEQPPKPTCASYDCTVHGLVQKPGSQNTPGSTVGECCAKVIIGGGGTGSMPDVDLNVFT